MGHIINKIMLAYAMEGIGTADVAIVQHRKITPDNDVETYRCMAPQQHCARRAIEIKQRIGRVFDDLVHECYIVPSKVITGAVTGRVLNGLAEVNCATMYVIELVLPAAYGKAGAADKDPL